MGWGVLHGGGPTNVCKAGSGCPAHHHHHHQRHRRHLLPLLPLLRRSQQKIKRSSATIPLPSRSLYTLLTSLTLSFTLLYFTSCPLSVLHSGFSISFTLMLIFICSPCLIRFPNDILSKLYTSLLFLSMYCTVVWRYKGRSERVEARI